MNPRPTSPPACGSLRPIGQVASVVVADLRFRRQVEHLHRLGPHVLHELLVEIGDIADRMVQRLVSAQEARHAP